MTVNAGIPARPSTSPSCMFNICALISFLISTCEEMSLPMKHSKKKFRINFFDHEGYNPWDTLYKNDVDKVKITNYI